MKPRVTFGITHNDMNYRIEMTPEDCSSGYSIGESLAQMVCDESSDADVEEFPSSAEDFERCELVYTEYMPGCTCTLDDIANVFAAYRDYPPEKFVGYYDAYIEWCDAFGEVRSPDEFTDCFSGEYDNAGDYAEYLMNETLGLHRPEFDSVRPYIDFEAMERDMEWNDEIISVEVGGCRYIFRTL